MPKDIVPDLAQIDAFLAEFRDRPRNQHPAVAKAETSGYMLGFLAGWSETFAKDHGAQCDAEDCDTCPELVLIRSMFAAYEIEFPLTPEELERRAQLRRQRDEDGS